MFVYFFTEKSSTNTKRRTDKKGNTLVICSRCNVPNLFQNLSIYIFIINQTFIIVCFEGFIEDKLL